MKLSNSSDTKRQLLIALIIPVLIYIIYGQTRDFSYNIDDTYYLELLPSAPSSFKEKISSINQLFNNSDFRPVTYTTILLESSLFSKTPSIFHTFNLIYFTMLCLSILFVFQKSIRLSNLPNSYMIALLAAVFFSVHPSHANVVSSIKNRESILSLFFVLWSLNFWIDFIRTKKLKKAKNFLLSIVLFVIAIMAKIESITFLLIIPITAYFIEKRTFSRRNIGLIVLFIGTVVLSRISLNGIPSFDPDLISNVTFDENPLDFSKGILARWAAILHITFVYETFMIWPKGYYFYFGTDTIELWTSKDIYPYLSLIAHLILALISVFLFLKRDIRVLGVYIFFISILPFLNIFQSVAGIVAVRYSFVASLGFCLLLAHLIVALYHSNKTAKLLSIILTVILVSIYSYFSWERTKVWKDRVALFKSDLPYLQKSVVANRMACTYFMDKYINDNAWKHKSNLQQIIKYADRALAVYDQELHVIQTKAKALNFLGRRSEAHELFRKSVKIDSTEIRGLSLLASHAKYLGYLDESIQSYEAILKIDSSQIKPYTELSILYASKGNYTKARVLNNQLLDQNLLAPANLNLGNIELILGDTLKSTYHFLEVLKNDGVSNHPNIYDMLQEYAYNKNNDSLTLELKKLANN